MCHQDMIRTKICGLYLEQKGCNIGSLTECYLHFNRMAYKSFERKSLTVAFGFRE